MSSSSVTLFKLQQTKFNAPYYFSISIKYVDMYIILKAMSTTIRKTK